MFQAEASVETSHKSCGDQETDATENKQALNCRKAIRHLVARNLQLRSDRLSRVHWSVPLLVWCCLPARSRCPKRRGFGRESWKRETSAEESDLDLPNRVAMSSDMVVNKDFATMVLFVFGGVSQGYTPSESICILMHLKIEMSSDFASAQEAEEDEQGWQFGTPSATATIPSTCQTHLQ